MARYLTANLLEIVHLTLKLLPRFPLLIQLHVKLRQISLAAAIKRDELASTAIAALGGWWLALARGLEHGRGHLTNFVLGL